METKTKDAATPLLDGNAQARTTNSINHLASLLLAQHAINMHDVLHAAVVDDSTTNNGGLTLTLCQRPKANKSRSLRSVTIDASSVSQLESGSATDIVAQLAGKKRKMLVLINPVSGSKKGVKLWSRCLPIMEAAQIECVEIVTTGTAHATQIIHKLTGEEMASYDGIIAVGGDGILFEVVEGFMKRKDWLTLVQQIPLAIIPAGSGNGLALSILHRKGETRDVESMAYLIARGDVSPMDLCSVDSPTNQTFSFLSTEWALASDIDITSEKYRCCGSFRFTCRGIELVFCDGCVRKYSGILHYLPVVDGGASESRGTSSMDIETGGAKESSSKTTTETRPPLLHSLRTLLPSITEPIGETQRANGWKTMEGNDWQYFIAMQTTHQASDMFGAPGAELDDGTITLCFGKNVSCAPCTMTSWLCNMEEGTHLGMKACQTLKVRAFRLEPAAGIVAIDGERTPLEPTQVEVHKGLLRILS